MLAKEGKTAKPPNTHNAIDMAGFKDGPAPEFAGIGEDESLSDGISDYSWFKALPPEQQDEVALEACDVIATKTKRFEIEKDGGNNADWYQLTTAVAVSGAPHAEEIFIKHALKAKNADPEDRLRQYFERCKTDADGRIKFDKLLMMAEDAGADFSR